jgi:LAS superfamily LD-carboxypeptidase LdcB
VTAAIPFSCQWPASTASTPASTIDVPAPRRTLVAVRGVDNLDPDLVRALRRAATDAAVNGIEFYVRSGWRSAEYQAQLFRDAVAKYGSEAEAARWVAVPDASAHVSGDAADIAPSAAAAWLSRHGAEYGLCQIYANEPWHYELRPGARERGCPPVYADPTHDPRMQRP